MGGLHAGRAHIYIVYIAIYILAAVKSSDDDDDARDLGILRANYCIIFVLKQREIRQFIIDHSQYIYRERVRGVAERIVEILSRCEDASASVNARVRRS